MPCWGNFTYKIVSCKNLYINVSVVWRTDTVADDEKGITFSSGEIIATYDDIEYDF